MCGIFGVINPTKKYISGIYSVMPEFFLAGSIRGVDGIGLFKTTPDRTVSWIKAAVPGYKFTELPNVSDFLTGLGENPFIVGHHRSATRGEISDLNSHPFEHKHICLVHNGTVAKNRELMAGHNLQVDSAAIAHNFAEKGVQETINTTYGAYSMVWYNSDMGTLQFLRNHERPMNFIHTKEGAIFFCSEADMGVWLLQRRGFHILEVESTEIDHLYTFEYGDSIPAKTKMAPIRPGFWELPKPNKGGGKGKQKNVIVLEEQIRLHRLAKSHHIGELFKFSVVDFDLEKKQGGFFRVWGEQPGMEDVTCEGNYSGDQDGLWSTKNLLSGVVTSIETPRNKNVVMLKLKDIKITTEPDPFFKEPVANGTIQMPLLSDEDEEKIAAPKKKGPLSTKSCSDCGHVFTHENCDDPYLVKREGEHKIICVSCFMDKHAPDELVRNAPLH